nr:hypothetical protein [Endozoicomonas sp.]
MNTSNLIVKTRITEAWQSLQLQAGKAEMHSEWKIRNLKPKYVKKHTLNESRDRMFTGVQVSQNPCFCRECKIVGGIPQFFPKVGGIPQFFPKIDLPIYRDLNEYQIPAMTESLRGFTSEHIKQEDLMAVYRASYVLCHKENVASESLQFWLKNTPINEIYEDEFKDSELEMFEKLALLTLDIIVHNKARGYVNKELLKKNKDGLSTIYFDPNTTGLFIFIMSILIKNTFKTTPDIKHTINEICSDLFAMKEFNRSSSQENKSTTRTLNSFVTDKKIILEKLVDIYFDKKRGSFYRKNYDDIFKIINSEKTINNEGTINDMLIASTAALNVHDQSIVAFFLIQCIRYVFEKILTEKPVQMAIESGDPEQFPSLTNQWLENISIKVSSKMEKKCHDKLAKDEGRVNARLVAEEQFKYATSKPPERIAEKDQHQKNVSIGLFMGIMPRLKQKDIESLLSALETIFVPRVDLFKENQSTNFKEWKTARC